MGKSLVSEVIGYGSGQTGFDFRKIQEFTMSSRAALGPTQPSVHPVGDWYIFFEHEELGTRD